MQLNIKYFGLLAELTQCSEEVFEFSGETALELKTVLEKKYIGLNQKNYKIAQNNELICNDETILDTEIALFPPFAGG